MMKFAPLMAGGLGLLLLALTVMPATAAKPVTERFVIEEIVDLDCGDYTLREDRVLDVLVLLFFDGEGELTDIQLHVHGTVVRTNLDSGASSVEHPAVSVFVDMVEETETTVGAVFNVVIQGEGIVIQDTGRVVFSFTEGLIFEAGHQEALHNPDLLCAHLR